MNAWDWIALLALIVVCVPLACLLFALDEPAAGDIDHLSEKERAKVIAMRRVR